MCINSTDINKRNNHLSFYLNSLDIKWPQHITLKVQVLWRICLPLHTLCHIDRIISLSERWIFQIYIMSVSSLASPSPKQTTVTRILVIPWYFIQNGITHAVLTVQDVSISACHCAIMTDHCIYDETYITNDKHKL